MTMAAIESPAADSSSARLDHRIVFTAPNVVEIQERPGAAPGSGEVLLKTRCSLISTGTELAWLTGPPWVQPDGKTVPTYPHYTGYSNAAVVVATGPGVTRWKVGDRVASRARHSQFPVIRQSDLAVHIPPEVTDEEATFANLCTTVMNGCRIAAPQLGECAVVIGQGVLGQLMVQYLRLAGCEHIVAVDMAELRLTVTERAGAATHCLNPVRDDVVTVVRDLSQGRGADIVVEATGRTETYNLALDLARRYGRVVGLGSPRWPAPVNMQQVHMKRLQVLGAIATHPTEENGANRWTRQANIDLVMRLLAAKRLDVRSLITNRFPAAEAPRVYADLVAQRDRYLGVILNW